MKLIFLALSFLFSVTNLQARDEMWYDYQSSNCCVPSNPQKCYSTDCYYQDEPCCDTCSMIPIDHIDFSYTFGKGIETNRNYVSASLMQFPDCRINGKIPFYQLTAHHLSNNKWAGSVGTGLRWMPHRECFVYGFNVFYDVIGAERGIYNQVGAGLEFLSKDWEAHLNGYLPVGNKSHRKVAQVFDSYIGPYFVAVSNIEETYHGADLEVGKNFYYGDKMRFYAGIGPAWFEKSYTGTDQWAFKGRLFLQFQRYISIELKTFKFSSENWHVQGVATLSVPFDCLCSFYTCGFADVLSQPVVRNAMIKKSKSCCWTTNY